MFRFGDPGGRAYVTTGTSYANVLEWWTIVSTAGSSTLTLPAGGGRYTGTCLRFFGPNGVNFSYVSKTIDAQPTWGIAFAFRPWSFSTGQGIFIAGIEDGGIPQVALQMNTDGSLSVYRCGGNTYNYAALLGTTGSVLSLNAYTHIEIKSTIDPSAGTVGLWANGSQKLNLTGLNTRQTSNSSANAIKIGFCSNNGANAGFSGNLDFDDVIVYDGQATDAAGNADITGPIGDCGLLWLPPNAAGTATQFASNGGPNYGQVIDANGVDGDTTYVESATVGNTDTYNLADPSGNVTTVKSVMAVNCARKTDVGSRGMGAVIRSGGTNYTHGTAIALGDSYAYYFRNWGLNPKTGVAWTPSDIAALEAGQTITS